MQHAEERVSNKTSAHLRDETSPRLVVEAAAATAALLLSSCWTSLMSLESDLSNSVCMYALNCSMSSGSSERTNSAKRFFIDRNDMPTNLRRCLSRLLLLVVLFSLAYLLSLSRALSFGLSKMFTIQVLRRCLSFLVLILVRSDYSIGRARINNKKKIAIIASSCLAMLNNHRQ